MLSRPVFFTAPKNLPIAYKNLHQSEGFSKSQAAERGWRKAQEGFLGGDGGTCKGGGVQTVGNGLLALFSSSPTP